MEIFRTLNDDGRTIVLVTHDPAVAAQCRRVARLEGGQLVGAAPSPRPRAQEGGAR
jgi:putative ABC transport system ATP-binding protein